MRLSPLLLLALSPCLYADEVGPDYDPTDAEAYELDYGYYPYRAYQSTHLHSPETRVVTKTPECDDGLLTFFTPRGYSIPDPGPMILDGNGDLVWGMTTPGQAYDFVVQDFQGEKYLSYWVGDDRVRGHGSGDYYMLNSSYDPAFKISAMNNLKADLHEMIITPEGTALITIYHIVPKDMTVLRDFSTDENDTNYIWDCLFQEIDIAKNELLFEWRASEHHTLNETYHAIGQSGTLDDPFDWFHINSVQKDPFGNYLVSARYTHSVTYVHGVTGEVIWVLGGKRNDFQDLSDGNATDFAWQHDARFHQLTAFPELLKDEIAAHGPVFEEDKDGLTTRLVTFFDNSAADQFYTHNISRGLLLEVTYPSVAPKGVHLSADLYKRKAKTSSSDIYQVRVVKSYENPLHIVSSSQGSLQVLPNAAEGKDPKILVGYGLNAVWTEYAASGAVLCDVHFATNYSWERGDVQSYRVMKYPWVGHPSQPPSAVLAEDGDAMFVSWNGATEVKSWILQHSNTFEGTDETWTDLAVAAKKGFETELEFDEDSVDRYLRVKALSASGQVLGISNNVDLGWIMGLSSAMPEIATDSATPLKLLMLFIFNISALYILYELYRRFNSWNRTRRWKAYRGFRLVSGDEEA